MGGEYRRRFRLREPRSVLAARTGGPAVATLSRLAAFTAVVAVVAGCSAAPAATSDFGAGDLAAALGKIPRDLSTVHGLDLPLDRSQLTPVEELEVIKARNTLLERCLATHGLSFTFPPVDPVRDAAKPRRHGLVDAAEAAAYGYRDPAGARARRTGLWPPTGNPARNRWVSR